jgi:multidrug efflux pump subunit AcrA (membrane-fusion protein)
LSEKKRGFSKKTIIMAVIGIILITGTIYGIKTEDKRTQKTPENRTVRPVKAMILDNAPGTWMLNFPGRVEAAKKAELSFRIAGKIDKLPVISGQKVQKGDLIAEIDPDTYKDNLTAATSAIEEAKSKLEAMKKGARPEVIASKTPRGQTYTIDKMHNSQNTSVYNRNHRKNFRLFRPT